MKKTVLGGLAISLAAATLALQVNAGGDLVKFPENYAKGKVYGGVDRPDIKEYREFYASAAALEAVKRASPSQAVP
jgi:hypothetical protein